MWCEAGETVRTHFIAQKPLLQLHRWKMPPSPVLSVSLVANTLTICVQGCVRALCPVPLPTCVASVNTTLSELLLVVISLVPWHWVFQLCLLSLLPHTF